MLNSGLRIEDLTAGRSVFWHYSEYYIPSLVVHLSACQLSTLHAVRFAPRSAIDGTGAKANDPGTRQRSLRPLSADVKEKRTRLYSCYAILSLRALLSPLERQKWYEQLPAAIGGCKTPGLFQQLRILVGRQKPPLTGGFQGNTKYVLSARSDVTPDAIAVRSITTVEGAL